MTGAPCGVLAPAIEVNDDGAPTGFVRGRCRCGWVSEAARATAAEAEADAQAHRAETANGAPPALTAALAAWNATAAALLDTLTGTVEDAGGDYPGAVCTPADVLAGYPELASLISTGVAWIITAHEHERRAAAYQSGGDALTAALRGRLDAAWEILTAAETAGRTVPASALREALEGLTPEPPGRPVTGGGPGNSTEGNRNDAGPG